MSSGLNESKVQTLSSFVHPTTYLKALHLFIIPLTYIHLLAPSNVSTITTIKNLELGSTPGTTSTGPHRKTI